MVRRSTKRNSEIREQIKKSGKFSYEIADLVGVSETTIYRWLNEKEMLPEHKSAILEAINQ